MTRECWGWTEDRERYHGDFATREEAIEEGRGCTDRPFYVAKGRKPPDGSFAPNGRDIVERMADEARDEIGEAAEDWPDVPDEALCELSLYMERWAAKHCPINFYSVIMGTEELIEPVASARPETGGDGG